MARQDSEILVTQPLLDRLIDREPKLAGDPAITRAQSVRTLKAALRRDLEWLLNSRRVVEPAPAAFEELNKSLYHYGLPDFSSMTVQSPKDRARLLRELERSIELFEPRLRNVRVVPIETPGASIRALRFQIEGMLMMDPAPELVSFDTLLQISSGECVVKGDRSA
jgi:type VI secretion system protein ImpF